MEHAKNELFHVTRAYEELMRRYQRTLFNVCARYLGNDRDADDVSQEIMLKVLYGLKKFEGKSKFKTCCNCGALPYFDVTKLLQKTYTLQIFYK